MGSSPIAVNQVSAFVVAKRLPPFHSKDRISLYNDNMSFLNFHSLEES